MTDALILAEGYPLVHALIYRVLGLNKLGMKRYSEAEEYFRKALSFSEHSELLVGAKTSYNLSNVLFHQGKQDEALKLFESARARIHDYQNKEYGARCMSTDGLFVSRDYTKVDKAIELLNQIGMDFELAEIAEEASNFAEKEGNNVLALKYMKSANKARLYQSALGGDQQC
ncbi:tetratricopeptide repeat protein [Bacillus sp. JCM 19041]|uniref:tetratricopeptide repeat protein n=1 Tax=Bacillus sp. JCM 19041 TaxID=1460637 RepID=UPI0006D180CA